MAGIDYTIPGQFKGIQLESPINAMTQAMQLRGLQEASQMNALKQQEYQQDVAEKNALAQIYANPNLKYGSPEFFSAVAQRASRYFEKIATGEQQRQLALSTQATREQQRQEAEQKQRLAKREFGLRKIASASDYGQAASLIERGIRTGEIDREEGDDMLSRLNPDTDIRQFRSDVLTNLLPADKALTAASDIEKANLGVRKERDEVEAKELDRSLAGFNSVYNPAFISTTDKELGKAQVTKRLTAMYEHPTLGAEAKKRMPYEAALKQHLDAYDTDPGNYIAAMMNLSGDKIIEARQKAAEKKEAKDREEYEDYRGQRILAGLEYVDMPTFLASRTARPATAPVEAAVAAPSPDAAAVVPAAAPAPKSVDTSVTVTPSGTGETKALAPVPVEARREGFDFMDPTAERLYKYATTLKDSTKAASVRAIAKEIQDAHVKSLEAKRKEGDFSAEYQDVILARKKVQALKKLPPTPDILEEINDLLDMIKVSKQGKAPKVSNVIKMPPGPKAVDEKYAQDYLDWTQGGGADAAANSAQIKQVLDRFANGEVLSGPSIGLAPDFFNALVNPEALGAKQAVQEVVQRNLRAVLGAQFTQVEGENLIARAFDPRLKPQENAKRLRKLFMQMQTAAQQKQAMAEYYEANETLRGFKGKQPKMQDFFDVLNAPSAPPKGSVDVMVDGKMHRFKSQADLDAYKAKGGKVDK
jgi:hypothetical protein